jgi:hypothetical protein
MHKKHSLRALNIKITIFSDLGKWSKKKNRIEIPKMLNTSLMQRFSHEHLLPILEPGFFPRTQISRARLNREVHVTWCPTRLVTT